jgi:opacity protein-like surface antigen
LQIGRDAKHSFAIAPASRIQSIANASGTSVNQTTVFDSETIRGRVGYALDTVFFYGTAGWAWSSNQYVRTQLTGMLNNATAGADEAVNKYSSGWTAGAGVAVAVAQNWNVFAEYRYTDYGTTAFTLPLSQLSTTSMAKVSAIEIGVNYMFNGRGPFAPVSGGAKAGLPLVPGVHSPYDWTGFYFGADGGFAWQRSSGTLTTASGAVLTPYGYTGTGPFAGPFFGSNYQFNRFMLGVEGDWQWSNLTGNNQVLVALGSTGSLPSGSFHGFHDDQGLWLDPRSARLCVRSIPGLRHRWMGPRAILQRLSLLPYRRRSSQPAAGPTAGLRGVASNTRSLTRFSGEWSIDTPIFRLRAS